ncbi:D-aminoacylase [bacterium]|nr:D-aminoacylase [bacterium]
MKYDIRIVNAQIIDGTGKEAFKGEVGIKDGYIKKVASSVEGDAKTEIDAEGNFLSPGFIDLHTHCTPSPTMNYLQQGVTTVVTGNCGFGFGRSGTEIVNKEQNEVSDLGPNFAFLIGHNTVRMQAMNRDNRPPTDLELSKMKSIIKENIDKGAFGFSTGLAYVPGAYSKTDEIIELSKVLQGTNSFYASHIRNEGIKVVDSVKEVLEIQKEADVPVHISHHKVCGVKNWGKSRETIALIKQARNKGIDVTLDQYPYTASCGTIQLLMPTYAGEGTPEDIKNRITKERNEIKEAIINKLSNYYDNDLSRVFFVNCTPIPELAGKNLADATKRFNRETSPEGAADTVLDIVSANPSHGATMMVSHSMSGEEVVYILQYPETCVGSDGWNMVMNVGHPHPRSYGTFPRVLGYYGREKQVISFEDGVKRMTSLPAKRLSLKDRGTIQEDVWADIVIWNPKTIIDKATFENPHQYPEGINYVIVNGVVILKEGKLVGNYSGRLLKKSEQ